MNDSSSKITQSFTTTAKCKFSVQQSVLQMYDGGGENYTLWQFASSERMNGHRLCAII